MKRFIYSKYRLDLSNLLSVSYLSTYSSIHLSVCLSICLIYHLCMFLSNLSSIYLSIIYLPIVDDFQTRARCYSQYWWYCIHMLTVSPLRELHLNQILRAEKLAWNHLLPVMLIPAKKLDSPGKNTSIAPEWKKFCTLAQRISMPRERWSLVPRAISLQHSVAQGTLAGQE